MHLRAALIAVREPVSTAIAHRIRLNILVELIVGHVLHKCNWRLDIVAVGARAHCCELLRQREHATLDGIAKHASI